MITVKRKQLLEAAWDHVSTLSRSIHRPSNFEVYLLESDMSQIAPSSWAVLGPFNYEFFLS